MLTLQRSLVYLGITLASCLTLSDAVMAGFVRIEGTGFSLQLGDRPQPQYYYPKYIHPHPNYQPYYPQPLVPPYYQPQPTTPSITITPQGTRITLPFHTIQRYEQRHYYYYGF